MENGLDSACPTIELVAAYVCGEVSTAEAARIFEHLERCEQCRTLLQAVERTYRALSEPPPDQ